MLAGGRSSRYGSPKQRETWKGTTLLDLAVHLAASLSENCIIIGDQKNNKPAAPVQVFPDIYPGYGPLAGIHAALAHSTTAYTATLPCDMPCMIPEIYRELAAGLDPERPAVAATETSLEPLVCIWPSSALELIEQRLERGLSGPIPVLDMLDAVRVPVHLRVGAYSPAVFTNINTRNQFKKICGT